MDEVWFRLDVWVPARSEKHLSYTGLENDITSIIVLQEEHLHEQVYSWKIKGDLWASLTSGKTAMEIKETLTTGFSCNYPPKERSFRKVRDFLRILDGYLSIEENRYWQNWEQPIFLDEPDNLFRIHPLLALYHHMKWIYDVFHDVPGASVTIR
jgi:hypothetical protein